MKNDLFIVYKSKEDSPFGRNSRRTVKRVFLGTEKETRRGLGNSRVGIKVRSTLDFLF